MSEDLIERIKKSLSENKTPMLKMVLEEAIYNLPIWDESRQGLPNLEDLTKELGIPYNVEDQEQEEMALLIVNRLLTSLGR